MLNQIDLSRTDLNLLVLFEAVEATRNVGRAAERLSLSASAVSHGLGRLRRLFGDPLFVKVPKGVLPTDRALALAPMIAAILADMRRLVAQSAPFDPATSTRRFVIAATDGVSAVLLPPLMAALAAQAPGIDISVRPLQQELVAGELDAGTVDMALGALIDMPARFVRHGLYHEEFCVTARGDHPWLAKPDLAGLLACNHVLVSPRGDARGFVDDELDKLGLRRRIGLVVPSFMSAIPLIAEGGFVGIFPKRLVRDQSERHALALAPNPLQLPAFPIDAWMLAAATGDGGLDWLLGLIKTIADPLTSHKSAR